MEAKYLLGKIYQIVDINYIKCYIGSTCEKISQRLARHRANYKKYKNGLTTNCKSFDMFDEFGVDNCKIELIEDFPCESKEQLLKREGYYIREKECVNRNIAGRTKHEYMCETRGEASQRSLDYYYKNRETILQSRKEYKMLNAETIKAYRSAKVPCPLCKHSVRRDD